METEQGEKPAKNKGGRPMHSMNKLSRDAIEKARALGELPHEFLLRIMRGEVILRKVLVDPDDPECGELRTVVEKYGFEERVDAAKAAAPYYAPKISTVELISGVPDDELDNIIAQLAAETGVDLGAAGEGAQGEAAQPARRRARLEP